MVSHTFYKVTLTVSSWSLRVTSYLSKKILLEVSRAWSATPMNHFSRTGSKRIFPES